MVGNNDKSVFLSVKQKIKCMQKDFVAYKIVYFAKLHYLCR